MQDVQEMDKATLFREGLLAARRSADIQARREQLQGKTAEERERHARQEKRAAEWQEAMDDAIMRAYEKTTETKFPSDAAIEAISAALLQLAELDHDCATERNGAGFSRADSYFGQYLARTRDLFGHEAVVGKALVRRYRRQLPAELVAAALEEPVENRDVEDDVDQGDLLKPIVPGAAAIMKLEPAPAPVPVEEESLEVRARKACLAMTPPPSRHPAVRIALKHLAATKGYKEARTALALARLPDWLDSQALVCARIVKAHRDLLPPDVAASALGETLPVVEQPAPVNRIVVTVPVAMASELIMARVRESVQEWLSESHGSESGAVLEVVASKSWIGDGSGRLRNDISCNGIEVDCEDTVIRPWVAQYADIGVAQANKEMWQAHGPAPRFPEPAQPAAATKKPAKSMKLMWNVKTARWELRTHTAAQCEAASGAGMTYDPEAKRYYGKGHLADAFREHIASPGDLKLLDAYMQSYTEGLELDRQRDQVAESPAPTRRRGRPSNADLGRGAALSQVERNRRYREKRKAAAVSMPRDVADRLAAARGAKGMTTGALLSEALDAVGA